MSGDHLQKKITQFEENKVEKQNDVAQSGWEAESPILNLQMSMM